MTMPDDVLHELVQQLRISEDRFRSQVDELRRVDDMLREVAKALRDDGRGAFATVLEAAEHTVRVAAAEVEHGLASWRRAVHRSLNDTQPIPLDVSHE